MNLSVARRRQIALAGAFVSGILGWAFSVFDTPGLILLVSAAGLLWSSRAAKAWSLAGAMMTAALFWSSLDQTGCSAWWRGAIVYGKLRGDFPYLSWEQARRAAFAPCAEVRYPGERTPASVRRLEQKRAQGRTLELYETPLGKFWIPAPGGELLNWLTWEITTQQVYTSRSVGVRPGDTVVDGGAHIGVFTAYALREGAELVVAVEPDPTNVACLEANLATEITSGRVRIVKAGLWHERGTLTFFASNENSAQSSFFGEKTEGNSAVEVPVLPLDALIKDLGLTRVDFIKMDIEGAERLALRGADQTLRTFRPRMAICTYHALDDSTVIPSVVHSIEPAYRIHAKDMALGPKGMIPKVVFFE